MFFSPIKLSVPRSTNLRREAKSLRIILTVSVKPSVVQCRARLHHSQTLQIPYRSLRARSRRTAGKWTPRTRSSKHRKNNRLLFHFQSRPATFPELSATANILKDAWSELGINVDVKFFNQSDLAQSVVETRNYDALLLGMVRRQTSRPLRFLGLNAKELSGTKRRAVHKRQSR